MNFRRNGTHAEWIDQDGTKILRLRGLEWNPDLRPVIALHGWPTSNPANVALSAYLSYAPGLGSDALVSTGRTVYWPFCGSNWGTESTTSPSVGGTGTEGIDAAIAQAVDDGLDGSVVDVWAISMGACNALNWGWRNPDAFAGMFLAIPLVDLVGTYDSNSTVATSMRAVHGGANKSVWLPLSEPYDPTRQPVAVDEIASRVALFGDRDDEVVPWAGLEAFATTHGMPLTASTAEGVTGGGHFFAFTKPGWSDLLPLRHFDSVEV